MSISHRICTEVQKTGNIWSVKTRYRRDIKKTLRIKGSRNNRGRSVCRPYTYASKYSTAYKYITIYGISQGKKFVDDI